MSSKMVRIVSLAVAAFAIVLVLWQNQSESPRPMPPVVTMSSPTTAVASPPLRDTMEQVRNARVRLMLNNKALLERAERTPKGKELVAKLREQNQQAEEAYQAFLKSDAEHQRLLASLGRLRATTQRPTNPSR